MQGRSRARELGGLDQAVGPVDFGLLALEDECNATERVPHARHGSLVRHCQRRSATR